jgi:hypothetical protein
MSNLTVHIVRRTSDDKGTVVTMTSETLPNSVPHRLHRRATIGHRLGLEYARQLQSTDTDVIAFTVSTTRANRGRMALASWRVMPTLSVAGRAALTGTHQLHPLVAEVMRGETFGQYLNRVTTESE